MIQIRNRIFWLSLIGMLLLTAAVILLPRYFSRSMDLRTLNRVEAVSRDEFSFLEPGSDSVLENIRAFRQIDQKNTRLELIATMDEPGRMNDKLLGQVYDQAMMAADTGYLPWIGAASYELAKMLGLESAPYEYWGDRIRSARYYNLTYDMDEQSRTRKVLNFWYLRFSDGKTFDYYFLVNSVNCQIYYAELYNQYTDLMAGPYMSMEDSTDKYVIDAVVDSGGLTEWFTYGCGAYYGADDAKYVGSSNLREKLAMVILNYEDQYAYVEQLALPEKQLPFLGISVGFQGLGNIIQSTAKE